MLCLKPHSEVKEPQKTTPIIQNMEGTTVIDLTDGGDDRPRTRGADVEIASPTCQRRQKTDSQAVSPGAQIIDLTYPKHPSLVMRATQTREEVECISLESDSESESEEFGLTSTEEFLVVTGSTDVDIASSFLEMSSGNLQTAIDLFSDFGLSTSSNFPGIYTHTKGGFSAGSRIKVQLGRTGSDYLLIFDKEDRSDSRSGLDRDQTVLASPGIPSDLLHQVNKCCKKERVVTNVTFGPSGDWFLSGNKRDGSSLCWWWGGPRGTQLGETCPKAIRNAFLDGDKLQVAFGANSSYAVIHGKDGLCFSGICADITDGIKRCSEIEGGIKRLRLLPDDNCFITYGDNSFTWTKGTDTSLINELKGWRLEPPIDVTVACDGSWIVIWPSTFSHSPGVCKKVIAELDMFYACQKRKAARIAAYSDEWQEKKHCAPEFDEGKRSETKVVEEDMRHGRVKHISRSDGCNHSRKRPILQQQVVNQHSNKRRVGTGNPEPECVSEGQESKHNINSGSFCGCNNRICLEDRREQRGDEKKEAPACSISCGCHSGNGPVLCAGTIAQKIYPRDTYAIASRTKNEADISVSGCRQLNKLYLHKKERSQFVWQNRYIHGFRTLPILEHKGEEVAFHECLCAEKIDFDQLKRIVMDLRTDVKARNAGIDCLRRKQKKSKGDEALLKKLMRCQVMQLVAESLHGILNHIETDNLGCIVHKVKYEQRDPSLRGRLYATGVNIKLADHKYMRTTTLQSMHSDLRAPLVGRFGHDIDCENSEVRLFCSLAQQFDLKERIPFIFNYRNNRKDWLMQIAEAHCVLEGEAKRLVNIILSGGGYITWLRSVDKTPTHAKSPLHNQITNFVNGLSNEIVLLRENLIEQPKFNWIHSDREKQKRAGKNDYAKKIAMMSIILQSCENKVLGLMHHCFFKNRWRVRAKIFDGLIVEKGPECQIDIHEMMRKVEDDCLFNGWDIRLIEKPLFGQHNDPIQTIEEARQTVQVLDNRLDGVGG